MSSPGHTTAPPGHRLPLRAMAWFRPERDLRPLVGEAPAMGVLAVFRRFWPDLRRLGRWLLLPLLLLSAAPAISVLEVALFQRLVDEVLVPADMRPLMWVAALYVGLNLLSAIASGADDYVSTYVSQRFLVRLRVQVFAHLLAQPSHLTDRSRLGDVMSRITSDVAAVESFMIGRLAVGVRALVGLVVYTVALFVLQWQLALVSLVAAPALWWWATHFSRLIKDVSRERRRRAGSLSAVTEESLANAALVQAYDRVDSAVDAYHRQNLAIARAELVGARVRAAFLPLADVAELAGTLAVIALGTWTLATGRLTLGGLLAFLALLTQCYQPLRTLGDLLPSLFSATAGVERIVEVLDQDAPGDPVGVAPLAGVTGAVSLCAVRVRYPGATHEALSGLDLEVRAGEVVALRGSSGVGKSTIARLLTRQVAATGGAACIDGQDVAAVTAASVRTAVTLVPQETALFDASIAENIAFGRPGASRSDIEEAARCADADGFVRALADGYDTRVGQRGRSLSGGQRQRIALARALLRRSAVLFLDEPTTGMDASTAHRLMSAVMASRARRTILIATHDPVVLEYVDRVVDLDRPSRASGSASARADSLRTTVPC